MAIITGHVLTISSNSLLNKWRECLAYNCYVVHLQGISVQLYLNLVRLLIKIIIICMMPVSSKKILYCVQQAYGHL
jgi:hypothetical protein